MSEAVLDGELAVVTGASRGIGLGIGLALARAGARVIGTATGEHGSAHFQAALEREALQGEGAVLDVSDRASVAEFAERLGARKLAPGILVNNAGITRDNLLMRMDEQEWAEVLETDLASVYRMSRALVRGMVKARRGRIINVSSVVASAGNGGQCNYAAAKAGMEGFTRSLARELGGRNITVNAVAPGFIDTDMTRALSEQQRGALLQNIPLGRLGSVEDVAAAVCFLASPAAAYLTGVTLHVNGGMYMA